MGTAPRVATASQTEVKEGLPAFRGQTELKEGLPAFRGQMELKEGLPAIRGQMELKEGLPAFRGLPWAEGWNPVGIPARGTFSVWRRTVRV
jgi:hypothetical protein